MRIVTALIASVSLVLAFAVAQGTGVRALGGVVLVVGGAWCAVRLWLAVGVLRTVVVGLAYAVAFVVSHPLGNVIGSWVAVFVVAAMVGLLAWALGGHRAKA
jgi:hypothetical protein